jgi:hypothetical protein
VLSLLLFLPAVVSALAINEIMYDPAASESYAEWIEIWNDGPDAVDLTGWILCGNGILAGYVDKADGLTYHNGGLSLATGAYAVIADGGTGSTALDNFTVNSSALLLHVNGSTMCTNGLSNSGETLTLYGADGATVDSITYADDAAENYSLERNTSGWFPSVVLGGTPGAANSILPQQGQQQTQQGAQQTSQTNLTNASTTSQTAVTGNIGISLVNPPAEVEAGSAFALKIRLFNNFSFTKKLEVSSYAFSGQSLATEGGWNPNSYTVVLEPGSIHFIDLLNDVKSAVNGTFKLRARAFDDNTTWDTETPLVVVEPETETDQPLVQSVDNTGNHGPTGAFIVGNVDLVQAIAHFIGGIWAKLTALLPVFD